MNLTAPTKQVCPFCIVCAQVNLEGVVPPLLLKPVQRHGTCPSREDRQLDCTQTPNTPTSVCQYFQWTGQGLFLKTEEPQK